MCGILGAIGPRERIPNSAILAGLGAMERRGPDSSGVEVIPIRGDGTRTLILGHRRLAIIDLSERGAQPMQDPETGNRIVYNGEIYNFQEIRKALEAEGARFRSTTDTEVLLALYGRRELKRYLHELLGMFAFALWDEAKQRLLLARDATGIKPLYYYSARGLFLFASEVRALLETGLVPRALDPAAIVPYLRFGAVQGPGTLIEKVRSLPPAHYLVVGADGVIVERGRYWTPDFRPEKQSRKLDRDVAGAFRALLERVVAEHLISDVPLGAFLSGGMDSSTIVALMARAAPGRVRSFSIAFKEAAFSEARFSRMVADHVGTDHQEIVLGEEDVLRSVPDVLAAQDQPSVDGVNVYMISREVRRAGITVVLSGQGGDEVLAGYSGFGQLRLLDRFQPVLRLAPRSLREQLARALDRSGAKSRWRKLGDLIRSCTSTIDSYFVIREVLTRAEADRLTVAALRRPGSMAKLAEAVREDLETRLNGCHTVNMVSALEMSCYLANMLLRDGDVMSMAHSLEVRVPFLDRRIVDFAAQISGRAKHSRSRQKPLLASAVSDLLPQEIFSRAKQGFTFPWKRWLRSRLAPMIAERLERADCGREIGLLPGRSRALWREFAATEQVPWTTVWTVFALVNWCSINRIALDSDAFDMPKVSSGLSRLSGRATYHTAG